MAHHPGHKGVRASHSGRDGLGVRAESWSKVIAINRNACIIFGQGQGRGQGVLSHSASGKNYPTVEFLPDGWSSSHHSDITPLGSCHDYVMWASIRSRS